ncbi:hypothetical protein V8G54_004323 [Vigna mungo]|uniref:OVATE domain-containing protein n=1 Tax=Vigna mungo TaxID=3915 RepID=A0AAQ3SB04_VIGMU
MQLRQTFRKTKVFFNKSFRNFLSFFFEEYQKLPRSFSFNPFLCRVGNARTRTSDQFYSEFYDLLQTDLNRINLYGNNNSESSVCFPRQRLQKSKNEERAQEKKKGSSQLRKKEDFNSENMNKKVHVLAQKMKAMDMVDAGDLERVLDIEEALHYYSRLKSPVYVDIVDTFFMNMQSELSASQPCASSIKPSKERLGPIQFR